MSSDSANLTLRGAQLILPGGTATGTLVVENGIITSITDGGNEAKASGQSLDLDGLVLMAGFIDVHIHGAVGIDTMDASTDDLRRIAGYLAGRGVTAWLPTLVPGPDDDYRRVANSVTELMSDQARGDSTSNALGLHYEGPFISSAQCGALRPPFFRTFGTGKHVDSLETVKLAGAVHMTTVAPEIDGGIDLVRELTVRGWIVSIGHTRAQPDVLDQACDADARHMTHFMNAMAPLHHRAPGPIGWGLLNDRVTCDMIADGVHTDPMMLKLGLRCKSVDRLLLISDAVAPAGLGDGDYRIWGEKIVVTDGKTQNERGSIAGSVITMIDAVRMMSGLGVPLGDVSRMASMNPARLLAVEGTRGSIEVGKRADLVALDSDLNVVHTFVGGSSAAY